MDENALAERSLTPVERDPYFEYENATPEQLKQKALSGDPFASLDYAKTLSSKLSTNPKIARAEIKDYLTKQEGELLEMREFYLRALNGGVQSAAYELSRWYHVSRLWSNKVESLAWRMISFSVGESKQWDCLRDSTICSVKEFNNKNRDEFFFPCVAQARDTCTPENYQDAALLAVQYVDSTDFAIKNIYRK